MMRMHRQPVMGMGMNVVMSLAGLIRRIDVDDDERQVIQVMKELVANLGGDRVRPRDRQLRTTAMLSSACRR
jgi:hypothetical protein